MATRRVRRIKRAGSKKKQSHHGRKTKHHHKRNHNRITRRHQGGMLKAFRTYSEGWKIKTEKGDPTYDGIQVRVRPTSYGENEYLIGNGSLHEYEMRDPAYGEKILKHIKAANQTMDRSTNQFFLSDYKGVKPINLNPATQIILTQKQFDAFSASASASAPASAPASAAHEPDTAVFALENGPVGSGTMLLYFGGILNQFKMDKPLEIQFPPNPKSKQNPVSKLIFLGNRDGITVQFVLKPDAMSYCAMARYDKVNQWGPSEKEFNYKVPSITKQLTLAKKGQKEGLDSQILPMIDNLTSYANDCADEKERMEEGSSYYKDPILSAHVPDDIKLMILGLFDRPSSPGVDALAGRMSELTPMRGAVARPPSSSSGRQ